MFTSIFGAPAPAPQEHAEEDTAPGGSEGAADTTRPAAALGFDIWGVAAAVSKSVRERADELVKSVQETDWKSELSSFSKGVSEDTKTLTNKTAELVEHLPEVVEQLPEKAAAIAVNLQSGGAANRKASDSGGASSAAGASGSAINPQFDLETVGESLTQLGRTLFVGTRELIDQVRDGIEEEIAAATKEHKRGGRAAKSASAASAAQKLSAVQTKYSRFEAEVAAMQRDSSTYLDEPEDVADFERWNSSFSMEGVKGAIDTLLANNSFMSQLHSRIVPAVVENEEFWTRYFYRLHKLQQKEEQRALLAQRAQDLSSQQEEELGWDDLEPEGQGEAEAAAAGEAEAGDKAKADAQEQQREKQEKEAAGAAAPVAGGATPVAGSAEKAVAGSVEGAAAAAKGAAAAQGTGLSQAPRQQEEEQEEEGATALSADLPRGEDKEAAASPVPAAADEGAAAGSGAGSSPAAGKAGDPGAGAERSSGERAGSPGADVACAGPSQGGSHSSAVEVSEGDAACAAETASESSVSKADWYVVNEEVAGLAGDRAPGVEVGASPSKAGGPEGVREGAVVAAAGTGGSSGKEASGGDGKAAEEGEEGAGEGKSKGKGKKAAGAGGPRAASGDEEDLDWGNWD